MLGVKRFLTFFQAGPNPVKVTTQGCPVPSL